MKSKDNLLLFGSWSLNICMGYLFVITFRELVMANNLTFRIVMGLMTCFLPAIMVAVHMFFKQESIKEELYKYEKELKRQADNHEKLESLTSVIAEQAEKTEKILTRIEKHLEGVDINEKII